MKVSELLTSPRKWVKGSEAADRFGEPINLDSPKAVRFCLLGAIMRCYPDLNKRLRVLKKFSKAMHIPITNWNDDPKTKFKDVRALIEKLNL